MKKVQINCVYQHFKGNYYYVLDIALDSETQERMVVYKPLYPRQDVTGQKHRFELVEVLSKNYLT